jgi:FAD synthetase
MAREKRAKKPKIVLASGVFDLLHLGHVKFLEEAKKAGGRDAKLIVIVARDTNVEKRKGIKPVVPENQRRTLVESLKVVDEAILGYEDFSMEKVIEKIKPAIIAVGHDSHMTGMEETVRDYVKARGLKIKIVKVGKFGADDLDSSSKIKQRIIENYRR